MEFAAAANRERNAYEICQPTIQNAQEKTYALEKRIQRASTAWKQFKTIFNAKGGVSHAVGASHFSLEEYEALRVQMKILDTEL